MSESYSGAASHRAPRHADWKMGMRADSNAAYRRVPDGPLDIAPAVRRLLRPWHRVRIPEIALNADGLAEASRVILLLVIRNQMFIKAFDVCCVDRATSGMKQFLAAHDALVGNLALLRDGHIGPLEVGEVLDAASVASEDLGTRRAEVLAGLSPRVAERLMDLEWQVAVSTEEIRDEIDRAAGFIADIADAALSGDWLSSSRPGEPF